MLKWGVIGVGRAGRARAAAIRIDERAELILGWGGNPGGVELEEAESLEALLSAVDAVAVCSPDTVHAEQVEQALRAGCHVLCEFPLAGTEEVAERLFAQADQAGLVLHVAHIELLTPTARWIRGYAAGRGFFGGTLRFTGAIREKTHSLAHANVARLHRVVDALGMPVSVEPVVVVEHELRAIARMPQGAPLELHFRWVDGAERRTEFVLEFRQETLMQLDRTVMVGGVPVALPAVDGLFATDQRLATAEMVDGALPYVTQERILRVLGIADALADTQPWRLSAEVPKET